MTRRDTTRRVRGVPAPKAISDAARSACAAFGLITEPFGTADVNHPDAKVWSHLIERVRSSRVVLITGPSGSGKTRALSALRAPLGRDRAIIEADARSLPDGVCAYDAIGAAPGRAADALSAAGLGEPALWARDAIVLSVGEMSRLALARAMGQAQAGDVVVCDEFASNLDRVSAGALAHTASRWARRIGVTLVVVGAHEDLPHLLDADLIVEPRAGGLRERPPGGVKRDEIRVDPGTIADYHALSAHHYLGGRPATVARILRATRISPFGELLAGVLMVSMPTLNGVWRRQAWPDWFDSPNKAANARRINRELRCISRVIVDPRSRGLGVATTLVRAYLEDPITSATESIAAMGAVSPFFRAAGMREYQLPRPAHDTRLLDALAHESITAQDLTRPDVLDRPFLARELSRWARHARVLIDDPDPLPHIARHAVCRLLSRPRAYAHTRGGNDGGDDD